MFDEELYDDPFDAVDWRWLRVRSLVDENRKPNRQQDDKYVWRGYRFRREHKEAKKTSEIYSVALNHRVVSSAYGWYANHADKKYFIEALLLCNDIDNQGVADYLGIDNVEVINTYSKLFFDIVDKRDNKGYLCTKFIRPALVDALRNYSEPSLSWKLFAIFGGFEVVKSCWEFGDPGKNTVDFYTKSAVANVMKKFSAGTYFMKVNQFNIGEVADMALRIMDMENRKLEKTGVGEGGRHRASLITDLLTAAKFTMIEGPEDVDSDPREPRLFEKLMMPVGAGRGDTNG